MIAPQTTEFGAKVGLLAGLVVMTPLRLLFDRLFQAQTALDVDPLSAIVTRLTTSSHLDISPLRVAVRGAMVGASRRVPGCWARWRPAPPPENRNWLPQQTTPPQIEVEVDAATLPPVNVGADVMALNSDIASGDFNDLAIQLAETLQIEGEAMLRGDSSLLLAVDAGRPPRRDAATDR